MLWTTVCFMATMLIFIKWSNYIILSEFLLMQIIIKEISLNTTLFIDVLITIPTTFPNMFDGSHSTRHVIDWSLKQYFLRWIQSCRCYVKPSKMVLRSHLILGLWYFKKEQEIYYKFIQGFIKSAFTYIATILATLYTCACCFAVSYWAKSIFFPRSSAMMVVRSSGNP